MQTSRENAMFEMSQSRPVLAFRCNTVRIGEFSRAVKRRKVSGRLPRFARMSGVCVLLSFNTAKKSDWLFVFAASGRSGSSVRPVNVYFTSSVSLCSAFAKALVSAGRGWAWIICGHTCNMLQPNPERFLRTAAFSLQLRGPRCRPAPTG